MNKINKNQERDGRETLWRAEQEEEEKGQSWEPKLFPGISMLWGHCCPRIYMKPRSWLTQKKGKAPLKRLNLRKLGLPMTGGHSHFLGPTLLSPKYHPISCSDSLMQTPPLVVYLPIHPSFLLPYLIQWMSDTGERRKKGDEIEWKRMPWVRKEVWYGADETLG